MADADNEEAGEREDDPQARGQSWERLWLLDAGMTVGEAIGRSYPIDWKHEYIRRFVRPPTRLSRTLCPLHSRLTAHNSHRAQTFKVLVLAHHGAHGSSRCHLIPHTHHRTRTTAHAPPHTHHTNTTHCVFRTDTTSMCASNSRVRTSTTSASAILIASVRPAPFFFFSLFCFVVILRSCASSVLCSSLCVSCGPESGQPQGVQRVGQRWLRVRALHARRGQGLQRHPPLSRNRSF
jgi:hypothetical protein